MDLTNSSSPLDGSTKPSPQVNDGSLAELSTSQIGSARTFAADLMVDLPTMRVSWPTTEIKTKKGLEKLALQLAKEKIFSLDTETGGEKGESIDTRLSIIQIGIPNYNRQGKVDPSNGKVFVVDVLALKEEAEKETKRRNDGQVVNPLAPLKAVLESETNSNGEPSEKLIHFSQFERGQFKKYDINIAGVVDTLKLAKALRPELESVALAACSVEFLGMCLSKDEQTSNWLIRPLTKSQFDYAALDAQILFSLYARLDEIKDKHSVPENASPEELTDIMRESMLDSLRLMRKDGAGNVYQQSLIRSKQLKEALEVSIRQLIPNGEEEFVPEEPFQYGSARVKKYDDSKIVTARLESLLPDIAQELKDEYSATQKSVKAALKKAGILGPDEDSAIQAIFSETTWSSPKLKAVFEFHSEYGTTRPIVSALTSDGELKGAKLTTERVANIVNSALEVRPDLLVASFEAVAREMLDIDVSLPSTPLTGTERTKWVKLVDNVATQLEGKIAQMQEYISAPIPNDPNLILRELIVEAGKRFALLRETGLGDYYGPAQYKANIASERLVEILGPNLTGDNNKYEYSTTAADLVLTRRSSKAIDLDYFRGTYPDVAKEVLAPGKGKIQEAMDRRNIDRATQKQIFADIQEVVGQTSPRFSYNPKFKLLYVPAGHGPEPTEDNDDSLT